MRPRCRPMAITSTSSEPPRAIDKGRRARRAGLERSPRMDERCIGPGAPAAAACAAGQRHPAGAGRDRVTSGSVRRDMRALLQRSARDAEGSIGRQRQLRQPGTRQIRVETLNSSVVGNPTRRSRAGRYVPTHRLRRPGGAPRLAIARATAVDGNVAGQRSGTWVADATSRSEIMNSCRLRHRWWWA
jgi:hypothetical protein